MVAFEYQAPAIGGIMSGYWINDDDLLDYFYQETLEGGADMEAGSVQENGMWYGYIVLNPSDTLELADAGFDGDYAVVILRQDDHGFKYGNVYETREEADDAWQEIEDEIDEIMGDD